MYKVPMLETINLLIVSLESDDMAVRNFANVLFNSLGFESIEDLKTQQKAYK